MNAVKNKEWAKIQFLFWQIIEKTEKKPIEIDLEKTKLF